MEKPKGAREYSTGFPSHRATETPTQKRAIVSTKNTVSCITTNSNARDGSSGILALQVHLACRPSSRGILQEPLPDPGREQLDLLQLPRLHPTQLPERGLRALLDLRVAPQPRLSVRSLDPRRHVHRVPALGYKIAHVEYARELSFEARLLQQLSLGALGNGLAWLQAATRQDPIRFPVRLLVACQEQRSFSLHYCPYPNPEIYPQRGAILAHKELVYLSLSHAQLLRRRA